MEQLKLLFVLSMIIGCLAEDMKKHQSNDTMADHHKESKPVDSKMTKDAKPEDATMKMADQKMTDAKMMESKMMDPKTNDHKDAEAGATKNAGPAKEDQTKDMKVEASVGLGFYGGVVPIGYGYGGYGYGYPSYRPYYNSYYPRPYYGYSSYRPIVPVIVKPRPIPVLIG